MKIKAFALLSGMLIATWTHAQAGTGTATLAGVVVNQTVTAAGQEFFHHFAIAWRERELADRYSIAVSERPSARWGSQIWVEFAQRRIFQAQLPAGRAGLRELSERAAEAVFQKVADTEVERLLFRDPDLATDEL